MEREKDGGRKSLQLHSILRSLVNRKLDKLLGLLEADVLSGVRARVHGCTGGGHGGGKLLRLPEAGGLSGVLACGHRGGQGAEGRGHKAGGRGQRQGGQAGGPARGRRTCVHREGQSAGHAWTPAPATLIPPLSPPQQ